MKATDYGDKKPLRCTNCDNYRRLRIKGVSFNKTDNKSGIGINVPFYDCDICKTTCPIAIDDELLFDNDAERFYKEKANQIFPKIKDGEFISLKTPYEDKVFSAYNSLGFVYDSQDYYYIPGLYRPWDEGFLCPVFFNKELLLYYNNRNECRVVFTSYSRMYIIDSSGSRIIFHGFGINRYGNIICWLGDLIDEFSKKENERHKKIFLAFNEPSNHDIISDYYFNQIEANFMRSDNEGQLFELRNEFDLSIIKKENLNITHINLDVLIEEYKHPIINETDQINSSYIKLNSLLIESLSIENLKIIIIKSGVKHDDIKGLKGLKLFEKLVINYIGVKNGGELVSPLYVLYDLRVLAGHIKDSKYEEKLQSCKKRLSLTPDAEEIAIYDKLITKLTKMYKVLIEFNI